MFRVLLRPLPASALLASLDWLWPLMSAACLALLAALWRGWRPRVGSRRAKAALWGVALFLGAWKAAQHAELRNDGSAETDNIVWNFAHGYGFHDSVLYGKPVLAEHAMFSLALLAPLADRPAALCFFQAFSLGAFLVAVFAYAEKELGSPERAALAALLAASSPLFGRQLAGWIDSRAFMPALFMWGAVLWQRRSRAAFLVGLIFLGCLEQGALALAGLGLFALLSRKTAVGLALLAASVLIAGGELALMAHFRDSPLMENKASYFSNVFALGWRAPLAVWMPPSGALLHAGLFNLLSGAAALPFLLSWLPHHLANAHGGFHDLSGVYSAPFFGPLVWSAIVGMGRVNKERLAPLVLALSAAGFALTGRFVHPEDLRPADWASAVRETAAMIPADAKLWCDRELISDFAARHFLKTLPMGQTAEFDLGNFAPDFILGSYFWYVESSPGFRAKFLAWLDEQGFSVVREGGGLVLFGRSREGAALAALMKEAEGGDASAQTNLGVFLLQGIGGRPDYAKARRWFGLAAEQGNAQAQANLGLLYLKGLGGPADKAQALRWLTRAAQAGNQAAKKALGQAR